MALTLTDSQHVAAEVVRAAEQARPFLAAKPNPDVVTDAYVGAWLDRVSLLLDDAARSEPLTALGPDHSRFDNLRKRLLGLAFDLLDAAWLSESTRSRLRAFMATCPRYIESRYRLTFDSFSSRIPQWERDLQRFVGQPDLRFLEIGSFEGHSACWLLENVLTHETSRLTCVDLFYPQLKELFDHNISLIGVDARVTARVGDSRRILPELPPDHYDFIYIDGSHDQIDVLDDAILAWRLLKRGGLMTFDDYGLKDVPITQIISPLRPDLGVDGFLRAYEGCYRVVSRGFQVTVEKLFKRVRATTA